VCSIGYCNYYSIVGSITLSAAGPTAFNSFSFFTLGRTLGSGKNPLPIELFYFDATVVNNTVNLNWSTATEINNHYFTIEKSKEGLTFNPLQEVDSKAVNGNSTTILNYKSNDPNPYAGATYYRLKQTDFNGNYTSSAIVSVTFDAQSFVSVFPNPASNNLFAHVGKNHDNASLKLPMHLVKKC
jgi:hypothetical protein